jgi:hypothetical protein
MALVIDAVVLPKADTAAAWASSTYIAGIGEKLAEVGGTASAPVIKYKTGNGKDTYPNLSYDGSGTGTGTPGDLLTIGSVTTVAAGGNATATITGTSPNKVLNIGIPRGATGVADTLSVGTITTLAAGASATATITGTSPNKVLNLGIPKGADGINGTGTGSGGGVIVLSQTATVPSGTPSGTLIVRTAAA